MGRTPHPKIKIKPNHHTGGVKLTKIRHSVKTIILKLTIYPPPLPKNCGTDGSKTKGGTLFQKVLQM